jgi:hypothetical protein
VESGKNGRLDVINHEPGRNSISTSGNWWLFVRRGEARARLFLAVAGILYIAAMFATFWKFGTAEKGKLIGSLLLETAGLLVMLSKRVTKKSR